MADIASCWTGTTNGAAFVQALEAKGYYLARGDSARLWSSTAYGEIHSLSRQLVGVAKSRELKDRLAGYPLDKLPDVESAQAWAKQQRIEREKQIKENQSQQEKQQSEVEIRLAALKERQAARRAEIDMRRIELIARHLSERDGLKAMFEAENTGVVSARLQKQPKGILAFLTRITGIQMITMPGTSNRTSAAPSSKKSRPKR
jgi:type II secretory pathway component HofQ